MIKCLRCFKNGKFTVIKKDKCPVCGCTQGIVSVAGEKYEMPKPEPICPDHQDNKYFQ